MPDYPRALRARAFAAQAEAYERARPGYPLEAIRACLPSAAERVLDLGAGTGKLTRGLMALGLDVVAVEPLEQMRKLIPSPAEAREGTAEALPLADHSVDAVTVGQAFHWFDQERALSEITRVLRPGGTLGLLWNMLDDTVPWVAALADAFQAEDRASLAAHAAPPYGGVTGLSDPERLLVSHTQSLDPDLLVENIASRSTVILSPQSEQAAVLGRVRSLAPAAHFELPYVCDTWHGTRTG